MLRCAPNVRDGARTQRRLPLRRVSELTVAAVATRGCVGISAIDRVCACSPPRSPSRWLPPNVNRRAIPQVAEREVHTSIAAEGRAQQRRRTPDSG